jgi:hypothetical protein
VLGTDENDKRAKLYNLLSRYHWKGYQMLHVIAVILKLETLHTVEILDIIACA